MVIVCLEIKQFLFSMEIVCLKLTNTCALNRGNKNRGEERKSCNGMSLCVGEGQTLLWNWLPLFLQLPYHESFFLFVSNFHIGSVAFTVVVLVRSKPEIMVCRTQFLKRLDILPNFTKLSTNYFTFN